VSVRAMALFSAIGLSALAMGCKNTPPPQVPVPSESGGNPYTTYQHDSANKPLPPSATGADASSGGPHPEMTQSPTVSPPQPPVVPQAYLDAYDRVGRPRLLVLVDPSDNPEKSLVPGDYELLEKVVRETISAGGEVAVVPASAVRERATPQQLHDIAAGRATAMVDVGNAVHADVLIEVKPVTSKDQTQLTAIARNIRDGQQIATATSAVQSASPRRQIDFAGRLLGERMVDALADAWDRLARQPATSKPTSGAVPPTPPAAPVAAAPEAPPVPPTPPSTATSTTPTTPPAPPPPAAPAPPAPPATPSR